MSPRPIALAKNARGETVQAIDSTAVALLSAFAGGTAHQLNNILTALLGNLSLAQLHSQDLAAREKLAGAERAALRARKLAEKLLLLSPNRILQTKPCQLNDIIQKLAAQLETNSLISCELELTELPLLEIDEGQIMLALRCLGDNALDAMPAGGTLKIRSHRQSLCEQDGAAVIFEDSGHGMGSEQLSKVFVPFDNHTGDHQGLGLTLCYTIIARHQGRLELSSPAGGGSQASVWLPCRPSNQPRELAPTAARTPERILIHEPEDILADVLEHLLQSAGHSVERACDFDTVKQMLEQAQTLEHPFTLLILDDSCSQLSVSELARSVQTRSPGLRLILTGARQTVALPGCIGLARPYETTHLLALVAAPAWES